MPVDGSGDQMAVTAAAFVVRSWSEDVALAVQRATESQVALRSLVDDPVALEDITRAVRSGSTWDDPFDAVRELAESGNRGLWDAWTKAEASGSLLARALGRQPAAEGALELRRARDIAMQASGDVGNWITTSGRSGSLEAIERSVRTQLDEVRRLGDRVVASAG